MDDPDRLLPSGALTHTHEAQQPELPIETDDSASPSRCPTVPENDTRAFWPIRVVDTETELLPMLIESATSSLSVSVTEPVFVLWGSISIV
jgi:hypothetical protein